MRTFLILLLLLYFNLAAAAVAETLRAPWRAGDVWRVRIWDELNLPAYGRLVPAKRVTDARFEVHHQEQRCGEAVWVVDITTRGGVERRFQMAVQEATGDLWEIREIARPRKYQRNNVRILPRTAPFIAPEEFEFFHLFDSPRLSGPQLPETGSQQILTEPENRGHRRLTLKDETRRYRVEYIFHPDCPWWTRAAWYENNQLIRVAVLLNSDRFRAADQRQRR